MLINKQQVILFFLYIKLSLRKNFYIGQDHGYLGQFNLYQEFLETENPTYFY